MLVKLNLLSFELQINSKRHRLWKLEDLQILLNVYSYEAIYKIMKNIVI